MKKIDIILIPTITFFTVGIGFLIFYLIEGELPRSIIIPTIIIFSIGMIGVFILTKLFPELFGYVSFPKGEKGITLVKEFMEWKSVKDLILVFVIFVIGVIARVIYKHEYLELILYMIAIGIYFKWRKDVFLPKIKEAKKKELNNSRKE